MQLSFRQKALFYNDLAQLTKSGIPIAKAFEILARNRRSAISRPASRLQRALEQDGTLAGAFRKLKFPPNDAAMIEAGEVTGRLTAVLVEMSAYYDQLDRARWALISKSLYPLVVLHLGALLLPIGPAIASGGLDAYVRSAVPLIAGLWLVLGFVGVIAFWVVHEVAASRVLATVFLSIPLVGYGLRLFTTWKFAAIFSLFLKSGGGLFHGLEAAAAGCGNAVFRAAVPGVIRAVRSGSALGEAIRAAKVFPERFERAVDVGEESGRLEEELSRATEEFQERAFGLLDAIGRWSPRILYTGVAGVIAWKIIETFRSTFSTIEKILEQ